MHPPDADDFRRLLDALASTFVKPRLDDAQVERYWNALKDLPLSTIRRRAENHERYHKFFPKPFELRPKDDRPAYEPDSSVRAAYDGAVKFNAETWRLRAEAFSDEAKWELLEAYMARTELQFAVDSDEYLSRMDFARGVAVALRDRLGDGHFEQSLVAWRICVVFWPLVAMGHTALRKGSPARDLPQRVGAMLAVTGPAFTGPNPWTGEAATELKP